MVSYVRVPCGSCHYIYGVLHVPASHQILYWLSTLYPSQQLRALYYFIMTIVEDGDIEAQKHGLVQIGDFLGPNFAAAPFLHSPAHMSRIHRLRSSIPIRIASLHVCTSSNSAFPLFINAVKHTLPAAALSRIQFHFGEYPLKRFLCFVGFVFGWINAITRRTSRLAFVITSNTCPLLVSDMLNV